MFKNLQNYTYEEQNEIVENVRNGVPVAAFGVSVGEKVRLTSLLDGNVVYIAPDIISARQLATEVESISGVKSVVYPPKDELLFKNSSSKEIIHERISALYELQNSCVNFFTTIEAVMQIAPLKIHAVEFKVGETVMLERIISDLTLLGYKRVDALYEIGQFCIRGDVIDIYPVFSDTAYSIDLFYDEVENITYLDFEKGERGEKVKSLRIIQPYEYLFSEQNTQEIKVKLSDCVKKADNMTAKKGLKSLSEEYEQILLHGQDERLSALMPIFSGVGFVGDYFKDKTIVFDEGKLIAERLDGYLKEFNERYVNLLRKGEVFQFAINQLKLKNTVFDSLLKNRTLALQNLASVIPFYNPLSVVRYNGSKISNYYLNPKELAYDCKDWVSCGYKVVLCGNDISKSEVLSQRLLVNSVMVKTTSDFDESYKGVQIIADYLGKGFIEHKNKLVVIGCKELFASSGKKQLKSKKYSSFVAPKIGDYAVHEVYGIGKVVGNKKISTVESTKDYLEIEYKDGDRLYVPLEQMDRISKYVGGEEPKLNKLGGEFERIKERVKQSISEMSINLKQLYKSRKDKKGFVFSPENEFDHQFAEKFEYEPTEDQALAIKDVFNDMSSEKIMDRLICGDVGYGKTEVAMRACFKAYLDGKQVAVVCPTTILSEQHFNTFKKRFEGFGARIEVLNRFKTIKQRDEILKKLKNGEIDIIIGTHALFGKNVLYSDLGLLVLDEEQRFGVEQKEKIKTVKDNIDTLTLTATPIPRTLHMSLVGIRDISEINTPPSDRIPTQTFVVEQADDVIAYAVRRELAREGQVFILYNRVESISSFASHVTELLPEAKISVAHGQMAERELENKIYSFYNGEFNVLICTTIIENGIDLPNANTLIVIDADRLGLSTLYQLRGRVGRGKRMAYAYFMYRQTTLSDQAYKRLNSLTEYSESGSGYKIALRDLEIRGAGNVLGREQHGHMEKIGYELYSKLLKEKLTTDDYEKECDLSVNVDAYIGEDYIPDSAGRMDCYKKIASVKSVEEAEKLKSELENVYGKVPVQTENLIKISILRSLCRKFDIVKAEINSKISKLFLKDINVLQNAQLTDKIEKESNDCMLSVTQFPCIEFRQDGLSGENRLENIIKFLQ